MPATSKTDALNLSPNAKRAADLLLAAHPNVKFTSGRRGVADQARAMASNVVTKRQWILNTYKDTPQRKALQKWVDDHPEAKTQAAIAAGLESVMKEWSDAQKARLSKHFSGQAFDVQPVTGAAGTAIKKTIRALPKLSKFLEKEGGLVRWHADFG
jgi:gamma-glutamyl:cysteine ligase YbdK (ATP-grasp superfamily)